VPVFVDTNVLVHWRDATAPDRQARAAEWLQHLWRSREGRLSIQVLNEYYVTVTRKLKPGLDADTARGDVRRFGAWRPVSIDTTIVEGAWRTQDRHGLSFWDSLIVSAAQRTRAALLLSEDLTHGQSFDGLRVVNPFAVEPHGAVAG
jgi:predicted nucleic acid-binding protein